MTEIAFLDIAEEELQENNTKGDIRFFGKKWSE